MTLTRTLQSRYELIELIGNGGLGELYRVRDRTTRLTLALRTTVFPSEPEILAALSSTVELHNVLAAKGLPVVRVVASGADEEGGAWYTMEFAAGESVITDVRRHKPMPATRALPLLLQLTNCVADLHEQGVLHQDLSP